MQLRDGELPAKENDAVEKLVEVAERGMRSGWNKWFARAKGKQNSTHDSHVVTAVPEPAS